jgi:nuclear GTP-binding protein
MVRKKVLSKRLTLKDKYKIKKRVAQHEKKKRKEARANPKARSKLSKDPGVPNLWPQQQEMMKKMSDEAKEMLVEKKDVCRRFSFWFFLCSFVRFFPGFRFH